MLPVSNLFIILLISFLFVQANVAFLSVKPNGSNSSNSSMSFNTGTVVDFVSGNFSKPDIATNQSLWNKIVSFFLNFVSVTTLPGETFGNTSIVYAVLRDQSDVVEKFLDNGTDIETVCPTGENETIFFMSCSLGHVDLVRLLYERGANFTSASYDQKLQPIHIAALKGRTAVVDFLLTKEPQLINATDLNGNLPIYWYFRGFAQHKEPGLLDVFLKHGAEVNSRPDGSTTVLTSAVLTGSLPLVTKLVAKGANLKLTSKGSMPIHDAAASGFVAIVDYLLKTDPSLLNATDVDGVTPLLQAVINGQVAVADYLLKRGTDLEKHYELFSGGTALHVASLKGHLSIVRLLVSKGANLAARNWNGLAPLHTAVVVNNIALIDFYLDNGANIDIVDKKGRTPLAYACSENIVKAAKHLIERGADLDVRDSNTWYPIHHAASAGSIEIVEAIVRARPYLVHQTEVFGGYQPIHLAIQQGQLEMVKFFVENLNVSVETRTSDGMGVTCLHIAASSSSNVDLDYMSKRYDNFSLVLLKTNRLEIIKYLVSSGADLTSFNDRGLMPIHVAILVGAFEAVEYLLDAKPELIGALTEQGSRPIHVAAMTGYIEIADLLLRRGENVDVECFFCGGMLMTATPFQLSVLGSNLQMIKFFVSKGANYTRPLRIIFGPAQVPFTFSCFRGDLSIVKYLVSIDPTLLNEQREEYREATPIHQAARGGQVAVVEYFLNNNVSVNIKNTFGNTPLHIACSTTKNNLAVIKLLVSKGANLSISNSEQLGENKPIHIAAGYGSIPTLRYFLSVDPSLNETAVNIRGMMPIHMIVGRMARLDIFDYFFEELGASINVREKGRNERTILHSAATYGNLFSVDYLIKYGADVMAKSSSTQNDELLPIHIAAIYGYKDIIQRFLRERPSLVNATDKRGNRPIDKAALNGRTEVVIWLARQQGGMNARNPRTGRTLLHQAASKGHLGLVKALIRHGADVNLKSHLTDREETPLEAATKKGWPRVKNYLAGVVNNTLF